MPTNVTPDESSYLDFEVEVADAGSDHYRVTLLRSPGGEAQADLQLPPVPELNLSIKDLQISLLSSARDVRRVFAPQQRRAQKLGQELLDALLSGDIRSCWELSQQQAKQQDKSLRLKLRIQPPQLANLPWEFLYDQRLGDYLCLSRRISIVRYLELTGTPPALTIQPPLRVLAMVASPSDLAGLDVDRERHRVEEGLTGLKDRGLVELSWLEGQTWRDLQQRMNSARWHIFHFIGHGEFDDRLDEGVVALADDDGRSQILTATQLGRLLSDHSSLRLVVLNSCEGAKGSPTDLFSSTAATLIRRGIPAVLAMQYEISDRAAIEFGRTFYQSLAQNLTVDTAVSEARIALSLASGNSLEWGTPVLYMRSPDGRLFNIATSNASADVADASGRHVVPVAARPVVTAVLADTMPESSSRASVTKAPSDEPSTYVPPRPTFHELEPVPTHDEPRPTRWPTLPQDWISKHIGLTALIGLLAIVTVSLAGYQVIGRAPGPTPPSRTALPSATASVTVTPTGPPAPVALTYPALISVDNAAAARDQNGLQSADIVFQFPIEGGETRLAAIFQSHLPSNVGPIRGPRQATYRLTRHYNAALYTSGLTSAEQTEYDRFKVPLVAEPPDFYRDSTRPPLSNLFMSGSALAKLQASMQRPDYRLPTSDDTGLSGNAEPQFSVPSAIASYTYDEKSGTYSLSLGGRPLKDGVTNQPLAIAAIIVITATGSQLPETDAGGTHYTDINMDARGRADFYGRGMHAGGAWSGTDITGPLTFTLDSQQRFSMPRGLAWIHVVI